MGYTDGYADGYSGPAAPHPTVTVEVAFTTTPFATPTWMDVSSKVVGGTVTRGRTSELDKIRAGQATVILSNEDRRFDPTHTTGPYYPNVLPMRRLRIRATHDAVTYDVFSGYVDRWEQTYDHPLVAYATVTATDAFKVLAAKDLPASVYAAEISQDTPRAWYRLNDPQTATAAVDSVAARDAAVLGAPTFGEAGLVTRDAGTAMSTNARSEGITLPADVVPNTAGPYTMEFVVRFASVGSFTGWLWSQLGPNSQTIGVESGGTLTWQITVGASTVFEARTTVAVNDGNPHHVAFVRSAAGLMSIYVDGTDVSTGASRTTTAHVATTTTGFGSPLASPNDPVNATFDELAIYTTALTTTRIAAHADARATPWDGELSGTRVGRVLDLIGWPAGDRTIDAGQSTLQAASLATNALAYLQKIEESEGGLLFVTAAGKVRFRSRHGGFNLASQGTFGDGDDTELEYVDIAFDWSETLIYNEVRVSRTDGVVQTAEDPASQTAYGERTFTADGLLHISDAESYDRANFLLHQYKDPVFRTTRMVVRPSGATEAVLFPQVLGRELGDKLTVRRKPQNVGATIDQTVIVEGLKHEFRDLYWSTEYMLSPSSTVGTPGAGDADFLQLNDTDGPGLGFVRLAY